MAVVVVAAAVDFADDEMMDLVVVAFAVFVAVVVAARS